MSELLKSLTGGAWSLIAGWIFPAAIAVSTFALFVFPVLVDHWALASEIAALEEGTRVLVIAGASIALGIALHALQTPLYRTMEGYTWPKTLRRWGWTRQGERRRDLSKKADRAYEQYKSEKQPLWEWALIAEKLQFYPIDDSQIVPTRLGNAFRAFETYGHDRFQLDSQTFWTELSAIVPGEVVKTIEQARAAVDFFVTLFYALIALGITAFVVPVMPGSVDEHWPLFILGATSLILLRPVYVSAVYTTGWLNSAVRALVNLGRTELAGALGLVLPGTLAEERTMWKAATGLVFHGNTDLGNKYAAQLEQFRTNPEPDEERTVN